MFVCFKRLESFLFLFFEYVLSISRPQRHSVQFIDLFLFPEILSFYSFPPVFFFGLTVFCYVCSSTELGLWAFGAFCSKIINVLSFGSSIASLRRYFIHLLFKFSCIYVLIGVSSLTLRMGTGESGWLYHWLFLFSFRNILNFVFILYVLSLLFSSPNSTHILPAHNPPNSMSFFISQQKRETHTSLQKRKPKTLSQRLRRQKCPISLFSRDILFYSGFFS